MAAVHSAEKLTRAASAIDKDQNMSELVQNELSAYFAPVNININDIGNGNVDGFARGLGVSLPVHGIMEHPTPTGPTLFNWAEEEGGD